MEDDMDGMTFEDRKSERPVKVFNESIWFYCGTCAHVGMKQDFVSLVPPYCKLCELSGRSSSSSEEAEEGAEEEAAVEEAQAIVNGDKSADEPPQQPDASTQGNGPTVKVQRTVRKRNKTASKPKPSRSRKA